MLRPKATPLKNARIRSAETRRQCASIPRVAGGAREGDGIADVGQAGDVGEAALETEEIDVSVLNDSPEPRLRREGAVILAECKNWTGKMREE